MYDSLFLLNGLSGEEKEKIISLLPEPKKFKKGEVIYSADSFFNAVGFVLSGEAVATTDNKSCLLMKRFSAGMCFGAAAVFGGAEKYVSQITAETETQVVFITEQQLTAIFKAFPKTAVNYITFLSDKVRFLNNKLSVISCQSAEGKLYKYLCSVMDENGNAKPPKSMTELAKVLGVGRASLYRSLETLEESGHIKRENNTIKVIENEKIS